VTHAITEHLPHKAVAAGRSQKLGAKRKEIEKRWSSKGGVFGVFPRKSGYRSTRILAGL